MRELDPRIYSMQELTQFVMSNCDEWRQSYKDNYKERFEEYYDIFRGFYTEEQKTRPSERSKLISPKTAEIITKQVDAIDEACFGRTKFFDIEDDLDYQEPPADATEEELQQLQAIQQAKAQDRQGLEFLKNKLTEDFAKQKVRMDMGEVLLNAAIFGTGIAEVVLDYETEMRPQTRMMNGAGVSGVEDVDRAVVKLRPIMPQNFLIPPTATDIESALGVAIDEEVAPHHIQLLQERGIYEDKDVGLGSATDTDLETDPTLDTQPKHVIRLTKYFGLVPRHLLNAYLQEDDFVDSLAEAVETDEEEPDETVVMIEAEEDPVPGTPGESYFVEAIVIIANGSTILKAIENPYMLNDRPVIAFPWDITPSGFWGRGLAEKAYMSQKGLDSELRGRADALALTNVPMIAMDATRKPRGEDNQIRPGKTILTNGNPRDVLQPFNFGQVSQITFAQAQSYQDMIEQATGSYDMMPSNVNRTAASAVSMSLGSTLLRQKRTLVNFQESFLLPFIKMAACRYMQYDTTAYPINDVSFTVSASLGLIQRELEMQTLAQLMQAMPADSPLYPVLFKSMVELTSLSNRDELVQTASAMMRPDPQAQQIAQQEAQIRAQRVQAEIAALAGQATESQARARKTEAETVAIPIREESRRIDSISGLTKADNEIGPEDKLKLEVAKSGVRERELALKERQAAEQ